MSTVAMIRFTFIQVIIFESYLDYSSTWYKW